MTDCNTIEEDEDLSQEDVDSEVRSYHPNFLFAVYEGTSLFFVRTNKDNRSETYLL